jgi:chromosome segregation ATPase
VPRLFDLVKAKEEKFLTAFYFALRDTLVAKDLDQATRIALQVKLCSVNVILSIINFYSMITAGAYSLPCCNCGWTVN